MLAILLELLHRAGEALCFCVRFGPLEVITEPALSQNSLGVGVV